MKHSASEHVSFAYGIMWMLLSATCLSFSFLFVKINLDYFDYFFLLFLRFFLPLLGLLIILALAWKWKVLLSKNLWLQLARSFCVLVSQYGFVYYLTQNSLLNATVLLNSAPLFIPLIEWIFLKHFPGRSTIVGAFIAFLGMILILHPDQSLFTAMSGIGILAALGQAGSQVLYGLKSKKENILCALFYLFLFTSFFSFFFFLFTDSTSLENFHQNALSKWVIYTTLFLMAITTLLNQYFRGLAYRCSRPSALSTFLFFSVFVSAICDWLIFNKTPTRLAIVGSCLIFLGGVLKVFLRAHILKKRKQ